MRDVVEYEYSSIKSQTDTIIRQTKYILAIDMIGSPFNARFLSLQ